MPRKFQRIILPSMISTAAMLTPTAALAGVTVDTPTQSAYDNLSSDSDFDSVGQISWASGLASGVYIGDGWVVTAAHVVDSANNFTFTINGNAYASDQIYIYDDWNGNAGSGNDVALIQLTTDVTGVEAAQLYQPTSGASNLIDQTATYTGYGKTGQGSTGATGAAGSFGAGQNVIEAFGGDNFFFNSYSDSIFFSDFDDPDATSDGYLWSDEDALLTEYIIASGDSGGGVFIDTDDDYYLVGVNSFILALDGDANSSYSDIAGATYLPDYYDWIYDVTAIPEPSTLGLLLLGVPALLRRRR